MNSAFKIIRCTYLTALGIVCVACMTTFAQTAGKPESTPAPLGKLVDVGGYRVHVYCTGAGSPTVVIVGAGFSFNWGLVQPEVAKFTQVCAYDHSGIGWSDAGPADSCDLRVNEVHTALKNLGIKGPYVLVGHSLGGLVARVYAGKYPDETAGIVFVDHAMGRGFITRGAVRDAGGKMPPIAPEVAPATPAPAPAAPGGPGGSRSVPATTPAGPMGIEGDPNFSRLSEHDRELHLWAMAQPRNQAALQRNTTVQADCFAQADALANERPHSLGEKPLVDVDTDEMRNSPGYVDLQKELLALSLNSKEMVAENSSHFVIIDRPDVVIEAIRRVVESVRNNTKL